MQSNSPFGAVPVALFDTFAIRVPSAPAAPALLGHQARWLPPYPELCAAAGGTDGDVEGEAVSTHVPDPAGELDTTMPPLPPPGPLSLPLPVGRD